MWRRYLHLRVGLARFALLDASGSASAGMQRLG
jgi:hypothetical protein